jgi:hypothetical protein
MAAGRRHNSQAKRPRYICATPLASWTAPVLGLGTGREKEEGSFQQASNMVPTWFQHACNYGGTTVLV